MRYLYALFFAVFGHAAMANPMFPTLTADDLNGVSHTLPSGLPGNPTIVFIAYKQNQQEDVNTWVYGLGLDPYTGPEFVELPVVGAGASLMRGFIDNGMRSGITDTKLRERTITIYQNVSVVNDPLGFSGRDDIRVLVVKQNGEVVWSTSGAATDAGMAALRAAYASAQ